MKRSRIVGAFVGATALVVVGSAGLASAASTAAAPHVVAAAHATVPNSPAYTWAGLDNGTCQNKWAMDLGTRVFGQPAADPAGNYTLIEKFTQGHFSTFGGMSPGACNGPVGGGPFANPPGNGHQVAEGLQGTFSGSEHLFLQNAGTFSALGDGGSGDGSCAGVVAGVPNECTTTSYISYHYSTGSTATISTTSYLFTYHTGIASALGSKTFTEQSALNNTTEADSGDIYTS